MPKESTGATGMFGNSVTSWMAPIFSAMSPQQLVAEFQRLHGCFGSCYSTKPKTGIREFKKLSEQILNHMQTAGVSAKVVSQNRLLIKELSDPNKVVSDSPGEASDLDIQDLMGVMANDDSVDLNETFSKHDNDSLLKQEVRAFMLEAANRWAYLRPFYVMRSKVNPAVLMIVTSVGLHTETKVKTNVNGTIGTNKSLQSLGEDYLVYENSSALSTNHDHADGRSYWGWAVKITSGALLRLWLSKLLETGDWKEKARCRLRLDPNVPKGYRVEKSEHDDAPKTTEAARASH
jgi:hypothetical protein